MKWDKRGHIISGIYEGVSFVGTVKNSRKVSSRIVHDVELFDIIFVDGKPLSTITIDDMIENARRVTEVNNED